MDRNLSRSRNSGGRDHDDYERSDRTGQETPSDVELFIKNLSYSTSEDQIGSFFEKFGDLESVRILRSDGKSRGIGFVTYKNKDDAQEAMKNANKAEIDGRKIFLNWANKREGGRPERRRERSRSNEARPRRNTERIPGSGSGSVFTAYVGNLSFNTRDSSIEEFFSECGKIVDVRIAKSRDGKSKGFAHVDFESQSGLTKALARNGNDLDGRELKINESKPYVPEDQYERKDRPDRRDRRDRGDRGYRGDRRGDRDGHRRRKYSDDD